MYLSRLTLNPRSRQVQAELAAPYEMHRTLMRAFPADLASTGDEGTARVLYRVDLPAAGQAIVIVQSHLLPDWSFCKPDYLAAPPATKQFEPRLTADQAYVFRLRANPTIKKQFDGPGTKSKRVGLYGEKEQMEWLERKLADGGFRLVQAAPAHQERYGGTIVRAENKRHDLNLLGVTFDGLLVVVEPHGAQETIARGVGSGKAFGFGLLSLARPN
ncbi:MAG: type I-E CRISPR-associated protein Cas6/Cse3/CasE [Caldilineaceae bacterium]